MALSVMVQCLAACQSTANVTYNQPLPAIATPVDGESLLYLFRPALDKVARRESPTLYIDDQAIASMSYSTYTCVSLGPGTHTLKLIPGPKERKSWGAALKFEVQAGETHFVAVWNPDQPSASSTPFIATVPVAHAIYFVPLLFGRYQAPSGVRFENVEADLGKSALAGLRPVTPAADHLISPQ